MGEKILMAIRRMRPGCVLREHLPAQFLGDTQPFDRAETRDPLAPIRLLALARGAPIPVRQFANAAGDHTGIVARPGGGDVDG